MSEPSARFDPVAIFLHWTVAVLVVAAIGFALAAVSIQDVNRDSPSIAPLVTIHRSLGVTILVLTAFNLIWRLGHRPPPLPETIEPLQRAVAHTVHFLLYALLLAMPLAGLVDAAAFAMPVDYFFLFKLPLVVSVGKNVGETAFGFHLLARFALYPLIVLHTAAALYHHYAARNDVLRRMLPRR